MHRWKYSVLATAAILSAGLYTSDAKALAMGRINVQSALGEPLRAEIELPQITAAEADSLRTVTASPDVFRAQGMEYSPAAHNVQIKLHRRPDGTSVLRLTGSRPVNEPFVDLVIDARWSAGHLVRSYTMLFDPPALGRPQATVAAPAQVTPAPRAETARAPRVPATAAPATPSPSRASAAPAAEGRPAGGEEVTVRPGDTAGRIASAHLPSGVSLDQMLVAMMQANPDAFAKGNVNRLRSGAVLQMPSAADAQATPAAEARKIVTAQSRDFNEYRRRMAASAPAAQVAAAERSASGAVQAQVEDKKPAAATPDKLTLSKGGVQAHKADEQLAREKQTDQNASRMAELSKNISELNQISGSSAPAGAAPAGSPAPQAAAQPAPQPGVAVPAPAGLPAPAAEPAAAAAAPAPADASAAPTDTAATAAAEPAADAAAPAGEADAAAATPEPAPAPAPAPSPAPQPAPYEEPSLLDSLTEDPLLAGGALALVLGLLGYGGYRVMQRRRAQAGVDSSFMESSLQPDSFFGASGGQRVDTANSDLSTGSSSMTYSPSQLDAGGDVDPVAEADVYLAYGRDLQAEEILKEALRHHPDRVSIPAKLAEIYAKRQDRKALESAAENVFKLTQGQGPDWSRVADLGRTLDPDNALYQPGGRPAAAAQQASAAAPTAAAAAAAFGSTLAASAPDSVLPDLDLDLDLDLHEAPSAAAPSAFAAAAAASAAMASQPVAAAPTAPVPLATLSPEAPTLDLSDLDLPDTPWNTAPAAPVPQPAPVGAIEPSPLDLADDSALSLMDSGIAPLTSRDAKLPAHDPLEFDLGDLSLDLNTSGTPLAASPAKPSQPAAAPGADALQDDPLATKLALAQEFGTIGDSEGARSLIEEVIAESSGALKERAQRLLAELG